MSTFNATNSIAVAINFFYTILLPYLQEEFGYGHFLTNWEGGVEYTFEWPNGMGLGSRRDVVMNEVFTVVLELSGSGDWFPVEVKYDGHPSLQAFPCKKDVLLMKDAICHRPAIFRSFKDLCWQLTPQNVLPALRDEWRNCIADICFDVIRNLS